jgi:hypothetical protein
MTATTIAVATAFIIVTTTAAFSQSAYTSGSAESNAEAGYPSPYSGRSFYNFAPAYGHRHVGKRHHEPAKGSE